jgi:hypothetical protein
MEIKPTAEPVTVKKNGTGPTFPWLNHCLPAICPIRLLMHLKILMGQIGLIPLEL